MVSDSTAKPCPCCRHTTPAIGTMRVGVSVGKRVICRCCGMNTGWHDSVEAALEVWNTRGPRHISEILPDVMKEAKQK